MSDKKPQGHSPTCFDQRAPANDCQKCKDLRVHLGPGRFVAARERALARIANGTQPAPDKPKHNTGSRPRYCRACLKPAAECGPMKDRLCEPCRTEHTTKMRNVLDGLMRF